MESMEKTVQRIIEDYPRMLQEESQFAQHLEQRENPDMRDALTILWIKINTVESWFTLLEPNERFVFRQILVGDQQENSAQRAAALMWMWQILEEGQTPWKLRERALEKIVQFAEQHKETIYTIFASECK